MPAVADGLVGVAPAGRRDRRHLGTQDERRSGDEAGLRIHGENRNAGLDGAGYGGAGGRAGSMAVVEQV